MILFNNQRTFNVSSCARNSEVAFFSHMYQLELVFLKSFKHIAIMLKTQMAQSRGDSSGQHPVGIWSPVLSRGGAQDMGQHSCQIVSMIS